MHLKHAIFSALLGLLVTCSATFANHAQSETLTRTTKSDCPTWLGAKPTDDQNVVEFVFYPISGSDIGELRRELNSRAPRSSKKKRFDALTTWEITWSWPTSSDSLKLSNLTLNKKIEMALPCWTDPHLATITVRERWTQYATKLLAHEMEHVRIVSDGFKRIPGRLQQALINNPKLSPEQANQLINEMLDSITDLNDRFDQQTEHGRRDGVVLEYSDRD